MIKKFKYMIKGIENPLTSLVSSAIYWTPRAKDNYLVRIARLTKPELDNILNQANAAWESACDWVNESDSQSKLFFECSTVTTQLGGKKVLPYVQISCDKFRYRICIPKEAEGISFLTKKFGDYCGTEIRNVVENWMSGDYTAEIAKETEKELEEMRAEQETDLFVLSEHKVWSVDSGECLQEGIGIETAPSVFCYKRCNYTTSKLEFDVNKPDEVLATEFIEDEDGLFNVECMQYCPLTAIKTGWLKKLEKLYRDGRSNLPDAVFDHIMETYGMTEEKLQTICGEYGKNYGYYNNSGVRSTKCVPTLSSEIYPASDKILSQDKVRDLQKLDDIVNGWQGKSVVSWKLDGAAVRLHYRGDKLVRAETKGKARDVTKLMMNVGNVPEVIKYGRPFIEAQFAKKEWFVTGELVAENERRSVAAGYLLRKDFDSEETKRVADDLCFVVYDSDICKYQSEREEIAPLRLYSQMLNLLEEEAGFSVVQLCEFRDSKQIGSGRIYEDLPMPQSFDVDGLVIRLNDIAKYSNAGETAHHPKGSVAFKFEDEWKRVRPTCIYGKRGSNNVLKIIAEFKPVKFGDKTVTSAVWQPQDDGRYILKYNSTIWDKDSNGREVWRKDYTVREGERRFEECFDVKVIEVCLRGCVIPQWRLIGEQQ